MRHLDGRAAAKTESHPFQPKSRSMSGFFVGSRDQVRGPHGTNPPKGLNSIMLCDSVQTHAYLPQQTAPHRESNRANL